MSRLATLATAACALVAASAFMPATASAKEAGDLLVRLRGLYVTPNESSSLSVGGADITGKAKVDDQVVPELDFSYFFTDNIAAELILATTNHDVKADGTPLGASVDLGDVWLLPPTLTLQYHLNPKGQVSPYVGAGVNYTIFYGEDAGAAQSVSYDDGFGWALQAGVDVAVTGNWFVNLDVKKLWLNTDVKITVNPTTVVDADVDLDPWIVGVGIGYRF